MCVGPPGAVTVSAADLGLAPADALTLTRSKLQRLADGPARRDR